MGYVDVAAGIIGTRVFVFNAASCSLVMPKRRSRR